MVVIELRNSQLIVGFNSFLHFLNGSLQSSTPFVLIQCLNVNRKTCKVIAYDMVYLGNQLATRIENQILWLLEEVCNLRVVVWKDLQELYVTFFHESFETELRITFSCLWLFIRLKECIYRFKVFCYQSSVEAGMVILSCVRNLTFRLYFPKSMF